MEAFGGPAQPSPTIALLNGGLGLLEVECKRCKTLEPTARCDPPPARTEMTIM
jgi:hypothetical protein